MILHPDPLEREGVTESKNRDPKREMREERFKKKTEPMWFSDAPEEAWRAFREETCGTPWRFRARLRDRDPTTALPAGKGELGGKWTSGSTSGVGGRIGEENGTSRPRSLIA